MLVADRDQLTGIGRGVPIFHRGAYSNTFSSYCFWRNPHTLSYVRYSCDILPVRLKIEVSLAARCNLNTGHACFQRLAEER